MSNQPDIQDAIKEIWLSQGLPEAALTHLKLQGYPDTAINSSFRLGSAAQASIGLLGLSAVHLHYLNTGVEQNATVDARHAVLSFHSEAFYTINDALPFGAEGVWDPIMGLYKTRDTGFVRIHTNFPHHRRGILEILKIPDTPEVTRAQVSEAILRWDAVDFETEAYSKGMCVTAMRSFAEWDNHPHAKALLGIPPVTITKIGEAPKRRMMTNAQRPLDSIRVLDLSRVLAGPVAGRALAAHGADVLLVTSKHLPALPNLDQVTSLGKRTTQLDLNNPTDHSKLVDLVRDSDIFLQAYRPGGLQDKGFGPKELVTLRPGIVCANLTAWGSVGPWQGRRGFDSLVQTATGFNVAEAEAFRSFQNLEPASKDMIQPRPFPLQAIDHAAGYLLAFGINAALCKTILEGGSYEVQVSLAAVGQWIRSLGRLPPHQAFSEECRPLPPRTVPQHSEIAGLSVKWKQTRSENTLTALRHAVSLSETAAREGGEAPVVLNAHEPVWLERTNVIARDDISQNC